MPSSPRALAERAPAKINLTLAVVGRRADGYHLLSSLVAFADFGDRLSLAPNDGLSLSVRGVNATAAGPTSDNLVTKAALALADLIPGLRLGRFTLDKRLPVAAGLGGGSADAGAALRLLARTNALRIDDPSLHSAAVRTGADVPVCVDPRARLMGGIGEVLSEPLDLTPLAAVLVNPGGVLPTAAVYGAFDGAGRLRHDTDAGSGIEDRAMRPEDVPRTREALLAFLARFGNDLETAAMSLDPAIADTLAALRELPGCKLARMSGSGATCFALFGSARAATVGARILTATRPHWWVRATMLS